MSPKQAEKEGLSLGLKSSLSSLRKEEALAVFAARSSELVSSHLAQHSCPHSPSRSPLRQDEDLFLLRPFRSSGASSQSTQAEASSHD